MINIAHRAFHLFREDAYREYCWSNDAWGSYQPASYIYLCFESLYDLCSKFGLRLNWQEKCTGEELKEFKEFPAKCDRKNNSHLSYGLITRLYNEDEVPEIEQNLRNGQNIICLYPGEEISLFYNGDKEKFRKANSAFKKLSPSFVHKSYYDKITNNSVKVEWEEVPTSFTGKLFFLKDSFLSDAYFKDGYGKTKENTDTILSLIKNFSIFKYPFLRLDAQMNVTTWPCNEPFQMEYKVVNHGISLSNALLTMQFNESFEPINPVERVITIQTGDSVNIPITYIPRAIGNNMKPISFIGIDKNGKEIHFPDDNFTMNVSPNYLSDIEKQSMKDNANFDKLLKVFENTENYNDLEKIPLLVKIDINSCLNKLRSVAELITQRMLKTKKIYNGENFSSSIRILQSRSILSSRAIGYLHTVRVIGNLASHPSGNKLSENDVLIASFALATVMEEIINKFEM